MPKLFYQGHASFRIETDGGRVIFIDPFAGLGYKTPADMILVTHEHYDHNDVSKVIQKTGCVCIRAKDALFGGAYRTFKEHGVYVKAFPAYNSHHPQGTGVGYLLRFDGTCLYHAGDTDFIPEMNDLAKEEIDYALLPIDGFYTMSPQDATQAALAINPKHMIPMHMKPGALWDYHQAMMVTAPMAMLMKPNDLIELKKE